MTTNEGFRIDHNMERDFGRHEHFHAQLESIADAADRERHVKDELRCLVTDAKALGISWEAIGAALGMSKQAAWERFHS